jgi:predicted RNA-binding protein with PIN domain
LVDAYNVIYATDELRRLLTEGQDIARDRLADVVRSIHDAEAVRVALVVDSRNDQLEVEHPFGKKTFEYLYAPAALTADGVIERIVRRAQEPGQVTVVSNDNLVREATRSAGGIALRPEELMEWAAACERRLEQDAIRRNAENAKSFRNSLDLDF